MTSSFARIKIVLKNLKETQSQNFMSENFKEIRHALTRDIAHFKNMSKILKQLREEWTNDKKK